MIKGHDKEWRKFVENRVREIQQLTPVNVWKHCPGIDNPADLPSRGAELSMIDDPLWLNGPKWLCNINPTEDSELPPENALLEECKEFEGIQDGDTGCFFTNRRIEWCFNLEKAPWWGGFFERLVRSVKRCLKKVIGHSRLSYDDLSTLIVEN